MARTNSYEKLFRVIDGVMGTYSCGTQADMNMAAWRSVMPVDYRLIEAYKQLADLCYDKETTKLIHDDYMYTLTTYRAHRDGIDEWYSDLPREQGTMFEWLLRSKLENINLLIKNYKRGKIDNNAIKKNLQEHLCLANKRLVKLTKDFLDRERDELIVGVCGRFAKEDYRENKLNRARRIAAGKKDTYKYIRKFFESFEGMEVINKDWNIYTEEVNNFFEECKSAEQFRAVVKEFNEYHKEDETEYEQLLMYYLYRYFLDSVYDYNLFLKVKGGIVGIIAIKMLNIADWWYNNKELSFTRKVDLAHLYSRQYEHSYYNYEVYNQYFMSKRAYAYENLLSELIDLE